MRGDYTETRTYYDERLALWRELGDRSGEIHSLISLGRLAIDEGDDRGSAYLESFFDQSFDRLRRSMQQLTQP